MKFSYPRCLELVERRLELLRALVRAEDEWRRAFIALNMQGSEHCTADAEVICGQIRTLDREISLLQASRSDQATSTSKGPRISSPKTSEVDPTIDRRIRLALGQMAALHLDLRRSNQIKQALLRRSKLTINALRNLFNSYAPTYAAPAALRVGTIYEENV